MLLRPFATKSGSYYLNVQVPLALRALAKGQRVSLPIAGEQCTVVVSDKVFLSLRTKEANVAKERFPLALNALSWPAAGFVDTEIGCFMKPEVTYAAKTVWA